MFTIWAQESHEQFFCTEGSYNLLWEGLHSPHLVTQKSSVRKGETSGWFQLKLELQGCFSCLKRKKKKKAQRLLLRPFIGHMTVVEWKVHPFTFLFGIYWLTCNCWLFLDFLDSHPAICSPSGRKQLHTVCNWLAQLMWLHKEFRVTPDTLNTACHLRGPIGDSADF